MLDVAQLFPAATPELLALLEAAPKKRMSVIKGNDFSGPLTLQDKRYVDTSAARGEEFRSKFFDQLCYDEISGDFDPPEGSKHILFFGHVGCGKSTELAHLCSQLHAPDRYWVLQVDLLKLLDPNNINYSDVWLAVAQELVEQLRVQEIVIAPVLLNGLQSWFTEQVLTQEKIKEFTGEVKTEAEAGGGLPFIGKLLARFTAALKTGSTYRETIRHVVANTFGSFIGALNTLFAATIEALKQANKGRQLLIMIDGADRFRGDDWRRFFIDDANQLAQAECIAVYTAPLALQASGRISDIFSQAILPMVKLRKFNQAAPVVGDARPQAYAAMRELLLKRCHYSLFDSTATLDALIDFSGGHIRDALRLLTYVCSEARSTPFDGNTVQAAGMRLAADFRAWLNKEHYLVLAQEDSHPQNIGTSEDIKKLVEDGALLEYNNGGSWRQCHPAIKLLPGFSHASNQIVTP